jgi:hypothetical protein
MPQSQGAMSNSVDFADHRRMANLLYQIHHGHIIVSTEGRPYLLDTGAPFSVGYEPLRIAGHSLPTEQSYMGVTASYLSDRIGAPVEGMIGADVLRYYNIGVYATERMIQFSQQRPSGDVIVPVQEYMGIPIVNVQIGDRVRRLFLDTGATLSYLKADCLADAQPEGRFEDFYPLLGDFLTDVYSQDLAVGNVACTLRFGVVPEELHAMLDAGNVDGLLGTELLRHFSVNLSMRDRLLCLELPLTMAGLLAG